PPDQSEQQAPAPSDLTPRNYKAAPKPPPPVEGAPSAPAPTDAAPSKSTDGPLPPPAQPAPQTEAKAPESSKGGPPPGVPAVQQTDWDVVPVFYGTDRTRKDVPERIGYSPDRARRLELGRALITVPKSHQVPRIERPFAIRVPYFQATIYQQSEDPKQHFT